MYTAQQHVGCSVRMGGSYFPLSRQQYQEKGNKTSLAHTQQDLQTPAAREKREKRPNTQVEALDVICAQRSKKLHLLEGTRHLSSRTTAGAIARQHETRHSSRAVRSKLLPGSRGQVLVSQLPALPTVMNEVLWVIHGLRSQGGADGAALAPNPALHHVSPSWLRLPKANSLHPGFCKPSRTSPHIEQWTAASLPCLWMLAKALFVFSSVWKVLCVFLAQLISYNIQFLQFLSAAQVTADQM